MSEPEDTLRDSPIDFETAVAYALHPEMRRLLILYVVGAVLLPFGVSMMQTPALGALPPIVALVLGVLLTVVAAAFLFAGLVGAAFKLVTDANVVAADR